MMMTYRSRLIASTSALAIALSIPHGAWAEEAKQEAQAGRLEEITVTARRVEENIQKVPMSVAAVSEERIAALDIQNFNDFTKLTPGWTVPAVESFVFLRGLQGVANYFADAPFVQRSTGQWFDVGLVQMLKGPQGTLFGQASAAGAIVVNPRKPSDHLEGFAGITVGDYGRRTINGAINVPVVEDKVLFRLAAESHYRKGYVRDIISGKTYAGEDHYIIRPSLIIRPTDNIENYTMVHYWYKRCDCGETSTIRDYLPGATFANFVGAAFADQLLAANLAHPYQLQGVYLQQGFSGVRERQIFIVNQTRWQITDNISLTNIFSYLKNGRRSYPDQQIDNGFSSVPNDPRAIQTKTSPLFMQPTWSDEIKLQGKVFDGLIDFTIGTFHLGNPAPNEIAWGNSRNVLTASVTKGSQRTPALSRAVYAQGDVDLSRIGSLLDGMTFTAGYRNTWDTARNARTDFLLTPGVPLGSLKSSRDLYAVAHFSASSWLFGLRDQITPDTMAYVTGSKGYTTGQVNPVNPPGKQVTQPEYLTQIEGGVKSTFYLGDVTFRSNVSVYYGWYSNIQVSVTQRVQVNPLPAPTSSIVVSENAANGLVRGFDADLTIIPVPWFEFTANMGYNKNKYTSWPIYDPITHVQTGDRRDTPFLGNPRFKWILSPTLHVPLQEGWGDDLSITASYTHTSKAYYNATFTNTDAHALAPGVIPYTTFTAANGFGPITSNLMQGQTIFSIGDPPFHNLDLTVKWTNPARVQGLTATFGIINVLNNMLGETRGGSLPVGNPLIFNPVAPRMFTLAFKYSF